MIEKNTFAFHAAFSTNFFLNSSSKGFLNQSLNDITRFLLVGVLPILFCVWGYLGFPGKF